MSLVAAFGSCGSLTLVVCLFRVTNTDNLYLVTSDIAFPSAGI